MPATATDLLARTGEAIARSFDAAGPPNRLLLVLELRWKLEEHWLLPALQEAGVPVADAATATERLRDVAQALEQAGPDERPPLRAALEGMVLLHLAQVDDLLAAARRRPGWNDAAVGADLQAMIDRWDAELDATGDIEDEERDPVGLPPR